MTNQDQAQLVPLDLETEMDPDTMPTQRIRFDDLEGPARDALFETLRRLDEEDEARAAELHLEEHTLESQPVDLEPSALGRHDWTPVWAFLSGFGTLALAQLAWWSLS